MLKEECSVVFFLTGKYVFPYSIPQGFLSWKECVVWRVTFALPGQRIKHVDIKPVVLSDDGLPTGPTDNQSLIILKRIKRYCQLMNGKKSFV
jgi:hypothetical protein